MTHFLIQRTFKGFKRPSFITINRSGAAWSSKKSAEKFATRESAERFIAQRGLNASVTSVVEVR
jgi:hypothetical protein